MNTEIMFVLTTAIQCYCGYDALKVEKGEDTTLLLNLFHNVIVFGKKKSLSIVQCDHLDCLAV